MALGQGVQSCAAPSLPYMGPSSRGGECLSQRGDTRMLQLGSPPFGLLVWFFVPFQLSEVPSHGKGNCCHLAAWECPLESGLVAPAARLECWIQHPSGENT